MLSCDVLNIMPTKRGHTWFQFLQDSNNMCTIFHAFIDKLQH